MQKLYKAKQSYDVNNFDICKNSQNFVEPFITQNFKSLKKTYENKCPAISQMLTDRVLFCVKGTEFFLPQT